MNTSPTIACLAEALSLAQAEMEAARKDSDNPFFHSRYADLASVWDACRGPLGRHGLAVIQLPETDEHQGVVVTTYLTHSSGEWVSSQLRLVPSKDDPQGIGSAITYARRYALAAAVGIAPEDDDGNAATGKKPETVTETAKVFTRPKPAMAPQPAAPEPARTPPVETSVMVEPPAMNADGELVEYIGRGDQVNFATLFRESLPLQHRKEAENLRHQWLAIRGIVDNEGKPTSTRIPKKDFVVLRLMATKWAREYSDAMPTL